MSFPVRVLHVIPSLSPRRGGPTEAILSMVRALNERGVRAEIATTNDDGPGIRDVPLDRWTQDDGARVRFFARISPPVRALREYAYSRPFAAWLQTNLGSYDIIHVHALFSHLSSASMRLARHLEFPYVIRPLGTLGRWPLRQSGWRKRIYLAMGEAARLRGADAIHFTSEMELREAREISAFPQGLVIPHGVTLPAIIPEAKTKLRMKMGLPPGQKLILFLGRMHGKKGLDLLLAAFAVIRNPSMTLLLAGDGEPRFIAEKKNLIRAHRMEKSVRWLGQVCGEEKQLLLQGADLFALVSHHENFGLAVLESLAAGTAVLVSEQVALGGEVNLHRLGKVVPLKTDAVAEGLREMLSENPAMKSHELRAWVSGNYSWSKNAAVLSELYTAILARHATRK